MIENIKEFCKLFYATAYVPISCFNADTTPYCAFPEKLQREDIIAGALKDLIHFNKNVDYFITDSSGIMGLVAIEKTGQFIIIGPVFSTPITQELIHRFLLECKLPNHLHKELIEFMQNTPQISFHHFLKILAYIHLCVNDKELDIKSHFYIEDEQLTQELLTEQINMNYLKKENRAFHNTFSLEKAMYNCISQGNVLALDNLLKTQTSHLSVGTVVDNHIRQVKDIFIGTATVASRVAHIGGLDVETAYSMADSYIFRCEHMSDVPAIYTLQYQMLKDFTTKVSESKLPTDTSPEIYQCIQFIRAHVNDPIKLHDVAEYIGRSDSHTSRKFKEELGFSINAFITRSKLEEAKSLLVYSDMSLSEISNYLCFSDQAYFQRVFKDKIGITPNEYRKNGMKKIKSRL